MQKKHDRQADGSLSVPGKLSGTISIRSLLDLKPIPAWQGPDHGICCHFDHISMGFLWSAKASFEVRFPSGNVAGSTCSGDQESACAEFAEQVKNGELWEAGVKLSRAYAGHCGALRAGDLGNGRSTSR
jgi:hypothetical protein